MISLMEGEGFEMVRQNLRNAFLIMGGLFSTDINSY